MFSNDLFQAEEVWNQLQQPLRSAMVSSPYLLLLAALETGWRIKSPVYLAPLRRGENSCAYYFFLERKSGDSPRRLVIPRDDDIERYVVEEKIQIAREKAYCCHPPSLDPYGQSIHR